MRNKRIVILGMCAANLHLQSILKAQEEILVITPKELPKKVSEIDYATEILQISSYKETKQKERNVIPINFYKNHISKK